MPQHSLHYFGFCTPLSHDQNVSHYWIGPKSSADLSFFPSIFLILTATFQDFQSRRIVSLIPKNDRVSKLGSNELYWAIYSLAIEHPNRPIVSTTQEINKFVYCGKEHIGQINYFRRYEPHCYNLACR